jgi:hypothetical protein
MDWVSEASTQMKIVRRNTRTATLYLIAVPPKPSESLDSHV